MCTWRSRVPVTALTILLVTASNSHADTISDGEFFDSDWTVGGYTTGVGAAAGTFFGGNRSAGPGDDGGEITGNPGAYRHFGQVHGGRQNGTMTIRTMHIYEPHSYAPSLGPLAAFDIAFDALAFSVNADGGQSHSLNVGPALRQENNYFVSLSGAAGNFTAFDQWESFEFNNLAAGDFVYIGGVNPAPQLDFSSTAEPIHFGYYAYNEGNFTTYGRGGVDNWQLSILRVPEPSALLLMLVGVGLTAVVWGKRPGYCD